MQTESIISRVWSFCTTLRDDGISYLDYLEQLTYLIFLKMADEYKKPPYNIDIGVPTGLDWNSIFTKKGAELENHYIYLLRELGKSKGILGQIFTKAQNKIQDPAKLSRLIVMVGDISWAILDADVKGDIYEGILEKNAEDTKSGAGQYFTPRSLIKIIVRCMKPLPMQTISNPACGTGGLFLGAYDYLLNNYKLDKNQKAFLKQKTFSGNEIVPNTRRMCLMNMLLHNIGEIDGESLINSNDALISSPLKTVDIVLANPPFGKKSSLTFTNEEGEQEKDDLTYNRQDFWATTSNKQVNFVQHIRTMLKSNGKAAVIVPDNVLFEGGAGETVRKRLLETTNLHTILRLPTGIFYAKGVKANVIFFDNKTAQKENWTKEIWIYDYRTNIHHTLKKKPLLEKHLKEFVDCFNPENISKRTETWDPNTNLEGRWRKYSYEEIIQREKTSLDISWLKDKSMTDFENLPEPDELALDIIENIELGLNSFKKIAKLLD